MNTETTQSGRIQNAEATPASAPLDVLPFHNVDRLLCAIRRQVHWTIGLQLDASETLSEQFWRLACEQKSR